MQLELHEYFHGHAHRHELWALIDLERHELHMNKDPKWSSMALVPLLNTLDRLDSNESHVCAWKHNVGLLSLDEEPI